MTSSRLTSVAADMRAKAKAATPGPWGQVFSDRFGPQSAIHTPVSNLQFSEYANEGEYRAAENAAYIAAMHPAVALALADLLDGLAADEPWDFRHDEALALCDAYEGSVEGS